MNKLETKKKRNQGVQLSTLLNTQKEIFLEGKVFGTF